MNPNSWISLAAIAISLLIVMAGMGYHAGIIKAEIGQVKVSIKNTEDQLLIWLDDAEKTADKNHIILINKFAEHSKRIRSIETHLIKTTDYEQTE